MAHGQLGGVLRYIRQLVGTGIPGEHSDGQLLHAFATHQDADAFEALVRRYAPLVWGVCRRVLQDEHEAEDVFQGTFLVLVRKAASLDRSGPLGNWLYTVAYHLALKARALGARRRTQESEAVEMLEAPTDSDASELNAVLDHELNRLPGKYRDPLVLCYLQGLTNEEAARELGWPSGSMSRHLLRGKELLRERLSGRGVALSAAMFTAGLAESACAAPVPIVNATIQAGLAYAAGKTAPGTLSTQAVTLAEGLLHATGASRMKIAAVLLIALSLAGAGSVLAYRSLKNDPPTERVQDQSRSVAATLPPAATDGGLAASVERHVDDWLPTKEERRIDEVGWASDLRSAQQLAKQHGRPVFLLTHGGNVAIGRCCGGSSAMRASALGNDRTIDLLNRFFVPVYISNDDYAKTGAAPAEEKAAFRSVHQEAAKAGLFSGVNSVYILDADGRPIDSQGGCHAADAPTCINMLQWHVFHLGLRPGGTIVPPTPQSHPPQTGPDDLVLHLTARYLKDDGGALVPFKARLGMANTYGWHAYPAENWIVLAPEERVKLLPTEPAPVGFSWMLDKTVTDRILTHCYPQTEDNDLSRNRIDVGSIRATIVRVDGDWVRAQLDGSLRMKHSFYGKEDNRFVDATLLGHLDYEPNGQCIRALRLYTPRATYGPEPFGAVLRTVP
jgi:RNA polymerase sigma factor (sigma-70 family)